MFLTDREQIIVTRDDEEGADEDESLQVTEVETNKE